MGAEPSLSCRLPIETVSAACLWFNPPEALPCILLTSRLQLPMPVVSERAAFAGAHSQHHSPDFRVQARCDPLHIARHHGEALLVCTSKPSSLPFWELCFSLVWAPSCSRPFLAYVAPSQPLLCSALWLRIGFAATCVCVQVADAQALPHLCCCSALVPSPRPSS